MLSENREGHYADHDSKVASSIVPPCWEQGSTWGYRWQAKERLAASVLWAWTMITDRIDALFADKGCDSDTVCDVLSGMNIEAVIPARRNRRKLAAHDRGKYRWSN